MNPVIIKRAYTKPVENDGYRVLVDRLWPRGVSKAKAKLDEWNKEVAPSTELRQWFNHEKERFDEFAACYKSKLKSQQQELLRLNSLREKSQLCLVYGAKDEACNHALVLKSVLEAL